MSRADELYEAFHGLCQIAQEADRRVIVLKEMIRKAEECAIARAARDITENNADIVPLTTYMAPLVDIHTQPLPRFTQSFSTVEEDMAVRRHARAVTVPEADYTMSAASLPAGQSKDSGVGVEMRRRVPHIPRVFTGSFSQLESGIRKMHLDKIQQPGLTVETDNNEQVKIRDFGATSRISPCESPITAAPLQRREAMVSRETELQDRVIRGERITSRRPSTKQRAQTIDNSCDLEAWLRQDSGRVQSPEKQRLGLRRGALADRKNTL